MKIVVCEYFTRYGNAGVPGECRAEAGLALIQRRSYVPIRVCEAHAHVIIGRIPELGGIERFVPMTPAIAACACEGIYHRGSCAMLNALSALDPDPDGVAKE